MQNLFFEKKDQWNHEFLKSIYFKSISIDQMKSEFMFFINESNNHLTIHVMDQNHKRIKSSSDQQIINDVKQLVVVGKNTIHDNLITTYVDKKSLTFNGSKIAQFHDDVGADLYQLLDKQGFIFHDHNTKMLFASRSFSQLVNYCLELDRSILELLRNNSNTFHVAEEYLINNDFHPQKIYSENVDTEDTLIFNLNWHNSYKQISFEMLIKNSDYKKNDHNPFFTEYTGTALNIGKFRKISLNPLDEGDRIPDLFPELDLNNAVVFTELFDDNAANVLVPNIMTNLQYQNLISEMKSIDRQSLSYSGTSGSGYGVQVDIELLDDSESLPTYLAKATRITIIPDDFIIKSFLKV